MTDQKTPDIIYTKVDEAPELASVSFLPIIQAFTVVIAVFYMLINLVVDLSYGYLDPRIRIE